MFAFSSVMLGLALFTDTKWLSNRQTILLFGGMWLISIAEWKMYKTFARLQDRGIALVKMSWRQRSADFVGVFLELIGIALIILFLLDLFDIFVLPSRF